MSYQPPLHIINKDKKAPPDKTVKVVSRDAKISDWTLSYRIKGMMAGLASIWLYDYFTASSFHPLVFIAGATVGWVGGLLVGRFFYRD